MTTGEIILYQTPEGALRLEIYHDGDTFWLSQRQLADLFGVEVPTISYHLKAIYESGELTEAATIRNLRMVRSEGNRSVSRDITHYHLDAVISVGYRVNSVQATRFRIWATDTLRSFITKGFVLDDERLKLNSRFGPDYFDELLERIREIRASERRFYLKITDIYEQCSIDYDAAAEPTRTFFKTVQNKLHWAITGHTAAELIAERADASRPAMGLTTWKQGPDGKVLKSDVAIAKNYLTEDELRALERVVSMYLDFAENQAARRIPMRMADWTARLDAFLQFNGYDVLTHAGTISRDVAKQLAEARYDQFRVTQDQHFTSDFERATQGLPGRGSKPS
ncbi:MAG: virulence RhuM family protein [Myxococcales bacterium]|nr:virulence RhuM family protein [Myxococcales bacterium]